MKHILIIVLTCVSFLCLGQNKNFDDWTENEVGLKVGCSTESHFIAALKKNWGLRLRSI